jgi:hypothetical protein
VTLKLRAFFRRFSDSRRVQEQAIRGAMSSVTIAACESY